MLSAQLSPTKFYKSIDSVIGFEIVVHIVNNSAGKRSLGTLVNNKKYHETQNTCEAARNYEFSFGPGCVDYFERLNWLVADFHPVDKPRISKQFRWQQRIRKRGWLVQYRFHVH